MKNFDYTLLIIPFVLVFAVIFIIFYLHEVHVERDKCSKKGGIYLLLRGCSICLDPKVFK